jgi:imidazolonepropionase-like amidohydrolase
MAFANLRRVHAAGVPVAAGSDAGNIGTLHGPALNRELVLIVEAGRSPGAALIAATRRAARVMGREHDLGTLEPGKLADQLVFDANPLVDIRNTRRIALVIKGGVFYSPQRVVERLTE